MTRKQSINRANFPRTVVGPGAFAVDLDEDLIVADSSAGAVTLNLPLAADLEPNIIYIKMPQAGGNNVTINAGGAETIDGFTSLIANQNNAWIVIKSDGSNWQAVAAFGFAAGFGPLFKYSFGPDNSNAVFNSGPTRIQDAVNAAAADPDQPQIVVGLPGLYAENVTISDGVMLRGFSENQITRVSGTLTVSPGGAGIPTAIEEIAFFQSEDAPALFIDLSGNPGGVVTIRRSNFVSDSNASFPTGSAVRITGDQAGIINIDDCRLQQNAPGDVPALTIDNAPLANVNIFNRTLLANANLDETSAAFLGTFISPPDFQDCRFEGRAIVETSSINCYYSRFRSLDNPCFSVTNDSPTSRFIKCQFDNTANPIIFWPLGNPGPLLVDCSSGRSDAGLPEFSSAQGVNLETFRLNTSLAQAATQTRLLSAAGEAQPRGNSSHVQSSGLFPNQLALEDDQLPQCFQLLLKLESDEVGANQPLERNGDAIHNFEVKNGKQYSVRVQGTAVRYNAPPAGNVAWVQDFLVARPSGSGAAIIAPVNTTNTQDNAGGIFNPSNPEIVADLGTEWCRLRVNIEAGLWRVAACVHIVELPFVPSEA